MAFRRKPFGTPAGQSASAAMSALSCSHFNVCTRRMPMHVLLSFDAGAVKVTSESVLMARSGRCCTNRRNVSIQTAAGILHASKMQRKLLMQCQVEWSTRQVLASTPVNVGVWRLDSAHLLHSMQAAFSARKFCSDCTHTLHAHNCFMLPSVTGLESRLDQETRIAAWRRNALPTYAYTDKASATP